ncbi:LysR substrate-binding domain-containing protein [Rhizobium halophytocola]|uniref:LysR family glycine cleavage system transcriptional activator n=1 Tax=Rhizobium halophytocola TaxID=735519 RepID=A0ABS4DSD2_9HYPH|nr:LysR substrate-binding domain-containing protein [Rhizobium halophytocola]MBP1848587.1 LysR family glycine cleavage system transcriptional activator [Rhizobium halophytocola]
MKLSRTFPLNALRVFEAVARLQNFTRAGQELGMTQTAVSYQIRLLEDYLGAPVFVRKPRQIALTEIGEDLLPKVADAFNLLGEAMGRARKTIDGTLEIKAIPTFVSHWLARHLRDFQLKHPDIEVSLMRLGGRNPDFRSLEADVAIYWEPGDEPDISYVDLINPYYTPLLSPALAASVGGIREPADLLRLPLISPHDAWWRTWFEAAGVTLPVPATSDRNVFTSQDLEASAALAGQGVAIICPFFVPDELATGRLVQPFELTLQAPHPIRLAYRTRQRNAPKIRAFVDWISRRIAEDIRNRPA